MEFVSPISYTNPLESTVIDSNSHQGQLQNPPPTTSMVDNNYIITANQSTEETGKPIFNCGNWHQN
jgi:hypothetical protein